MSAHTLPQVRPYGTKPRAVWPAGLPLPPGNIKNVHVRGAAVDCLFYGGVLDLVKIGGAWIRAEFALTSDFMDEIEAAYREQSL